MTERLLSSTTQLAHSNAAITSPSLHSNPSITAHDAQPVPESVEEEPYTIKCICDYSDDDGNTIYCETCDTWQHIECFYPGCVDDAAKEEFDHSCVDCKPRPLDGRHATERQRQQRQNKANSEGNEKKTKRTISKSHKKKPKPSELQVNGHHHETETLKHGSPHDHHPPAKPKGHRSGKSISSGSKRSPSYNSRPTQNHAHPPSPAHTPPDLPTGFEVHGYSENFLSLYKIDPTTPTEANTYSSLNVSNTMSSWLHDPTKLRNDTGVENGDEVFYKVKVGLEELKWPDLRIERKTDLYCDDIHLEWRYLVTEKQLPPSSRIGELNGLVGFQRDYVSDPDIGWQITPHPRPFVFFHPRLPIFIDTRRQGSECRYVRRSCRPNTSLEIYTIADSAEYHFWLISEGALASNEQITLAWNFRFPSDVHSRFLRLLNLSDGDGPRSEGTDLSEEEYTIISDVIYQVLSDHGGCACDLGSNCQFARFHRNYRGRLQPQANGTKPKKGRKAKTHTSPNSTGYATNSRAASEGQQEHQDGDDDNRSMSGSVKSKPRSRDLTPLHGAPNSLVSETSDREKRKLAIEEQLFQKQAEQGQPPRKKKRASDGSSMSTSLPTQPGSQASKTKQKSSAPRVPLPQTASNSTNGPRARQYVDAGTSRRNSGSPHSVVSPTAIVPRLQSPAIRQEPMRSPSRQPSTAPISSYVSSSTQTDCVENAWYSRHIATPKPKKNIITLSQRLLKNRQRLRVGQESKLADEANGSVEPSARTAEAGLDLESVNGVDSESANGLDHESNGSPSDMRGRAASIVSSTASVELPSSTSDVHMLDAPVIPSTNSTKPPPPSWPDAPVSTGTVENSTVPILKDAHNPTPLLPVIQTSIPTNLPVSVSSNFSSTPASLTGQPPFANNFPNTFTSPVTHGSFQPVPPKTTKKLSLSDYKARRKLTDTAPNTTPPVLNHPLSAVDEIKRAEILEGSAIVDTPMVEKALDPMQSAVPSSIPATSSSPTVGVNGSL